MGLESGVYIDDFITTNPVVGDQGKTLADHIWLIKTVLQNTFPNIDGAVNPTPAEINVLASVTPGTSAASKALVLDASSNLAAGTLNNLTAAGTVTAATVVAAGTVTAATVVAANAPLQRGKQTDAVEHTPITSTSYVTVSDVFSITPTTANTKLEGTLIVSATAKEVGDARKTIRAYVSAGHLNGSDVAVEDGNDYLMRSYNSQPSGTYHGGEIACTMVIPVDLASTDLDSGGDWSVMVRGKVEYVTDDLTVHHVHFRYEEFAE